MSDMSDLVRNPDPADFDWGVGIGGEVRTVVEAATHADGAAPLDEAAQLRLRHHGLEGSTLLVTGEPVTGFAWLHEGSVDIVVHPEHRRRGLGRALLQATLERTDRAESLTVWSHGHHPAAPALAHTGGFDRVRDLWLLRRPLGDTAPLPSLPDPAEVPWMVRTFRQGHDEDAFLALNATAFADHPEQGRLTRADLDQRMSEGWFDPKGFFIAEDPTQPEGSLVGFHWTKVHPDEPGTGEVYVVGVSPRAQGSGLGRLLTLTGLHHLAARGLREVVLYVESDNAPAIAVYTRLGFSHADADTHVMYRRA